MNRDVRLFLGVTFGLSWLLALVFRLAGGEWGATPATAVVGVVYMWMPFVGALVVRVLVRKAPFFPHIGCGFGITGWWFTGWLLPVVLAVGAFGIALLLPGVEYSPEMDGIFNAMVRHLSAEEVMAARESVSAMAVHPFVLVITSGLLAGATVNALAAFGEESGWRGFLYTELMPLGFWRASLAIGLIWGVWHAPLILMGHNYPEHPVAGVFMMTAFCTLLSPVIMYVRAKACSTVAAAIFHGTLNGTAGLATLLLNGGTDLTVGVTGAAGLVALALANGCIALYDAKFAREPVINPRTPQGYI